MLPHRLLRGVWGGGKQLGHRRSAACPPTAGESLCLNRTQVSPDPRGANVPRDREVRRTRAHRGVYSWRPRPGEPRDPLVRRLMRYAVFAHGLHLFITTLVRMNYCVDNYSESFCKLTRGKLFATEDEGTHSRKAFSQGLGTRANQASRKEEDSWWAVLCPTPWSHGDGRAPADRLSGCSRVGPEPGVGPESPACGRGLLGSA